MQYLDVAARSCHTCVRQTPTVLRAVLVAFTWTFRVVAVRVFIGAWFWVLVPAFCCRRVLTHLVLIPPQHPIHPLSSLDLSSQGFLQAPPVRLEILRPLHAHRGGRARRRNRPVGVDRRCCEHENIGKFHPRICPLSLNLVCMYQRQSKIPGTNGFCAFSHLFCHAEGISGFFVGLVHRQQEGVHHPCHSPNAESAEQPHT